MFYLSLMVTTRRIADAQLASANLEIDDPMAVENLSLDRPDPNLTPEIFSEFHRPQTEEPVWCCHCQAKRPWNGFVIENGTGFRYLIGSHCGPKYYELSFAQARRQHDELKQRKGLRLRLDAIVGSAPATEATIREILLSDELRSLDAARLKFSKYGGDAYFLLESLARKGSNLMVSVQVRDYAAEAARPDSNDDAGPIYTFQDQPIGALEGRALLISRGDCRDHLLDLRSALKEACGASSAGTDGLTTTAFQKLVRKCEEARDLAAESITAARAIPAFFSEAHLARLEQWAEQHQNFSFRALDAGLEVSLRSKVPILIERIDAVTIADLPPVIGNDS